MLKNIRKILIIKTSSLGDIIHAIPFLCTLYNGIEGACIHWILEEHYKDLLMNHPFIEKVILFKKNLSSFFKLKKMEDYDMAIDLQGLLKSAIILLSVKSKRKIFFYTRNEASWIPFFERIKAPTIHAVKRYLYLAKLFGIKEREEFIFPSSFFEDEWAEEVFKSHKIYRPIGICLQSRWQSKSMDASFVKSISERLFEEGYNPVIFSKEKICEEKKEGMLYAHAFGLKKIASLIKRCKIFLGVDTGLLHLAAAIGIPTIALFGPTSPTLTGPYGEVHKVLKKTIPCSPCFKRVCTKKECMRFEEEEIIYAIRRQD